MLEFMNTIFCCDYNACFSFQIHPPLGFGCGDGHKPVSVPQTQPLPAPVVPWPEPAIPQPAPAQPDDNET